MIRRMKKIAVSTMIAGALGAVTLGITSPTASANPWGGCGFGNVGVNYNYHGSNCGHRVWKGGPAGLPPVLVPIQQVNWRWDWRCENGRWDWYLNPPWYGAHPW